MSDLPILSISIFLPLFSALYITFFISHSKSRRKQLYAMYVAMLASLLTFITTIYLIFSFDPNIPDFQFVENYRWIDSIGLEFHVAVDSLSVYLIFLTALLIYFVVIILTKGRNLYSFLSRTLHNK